ncbi:hypothetical protein GWI33_000886, partial [Rhynchophorus ferrugineus]
SGLIRVGDRLLKVDRHSLINKTLLEAQQILRETAGCSSHGIGLSTLTIEYDVSVMESVKYASGPLLVEIDRQVEEDFGLLLTNCSSMIEAQSSQDDILAVGFYVDRIIPASTADRCGALSIGDQILAIDELPLDSWSGSPSDAEKLLRRATKLQVLPYSAMQKSQTRSQFGVHIERIETRSPINRNVRRQSHLKNPLNAKANYGPRFLDPTNKHTADIHCFIPSVEQAVTRSSLRSSDWA